MPARPNHCDLLVIREAAGYYAVTCTCERLRQVYSTRDAATREAVRHGEATGCGYSVTQR